LVLPKQEYYFQRKNVNAKKCNKVIGIKSLKAKKTKENLYFFLIFFVSKQKLEKKEK